MSGPRHGLALCDEATKDTLLNAKSCVVDHFRGGEDYFDAAKIVEWIRLERRWEEANRAAAADATSARSAAQTARRARERRERAQRTFGHRRATRELIDAVSSRVSAQCQARIEAMLWSDMPDRVLFGSDEERKLHAALIGIVGRRVFDRAVRAVRRRRVRRDAAASHSTAAPLSTCAAFVEDVYGNVYANAATRDRAHSTCSSLSRGCCAVRAVSNARFVECPYWDSPNRDAWGRDC